MAYCDQSANQSPEESNKWDEGLKSANEASEKFRNAELKHQNKDRARANELVQEAQTALKLSLETIPIFDKTDFIMNGWDDDKVEDS